MPAAGTSTTRISWVANAVDAMASVPNTASATRFVSRCSSNAAEDSGEPIKIRFTSEYTGRACHAPPAASRLAGPSGPSALSDAAAS